jgi:hypothetical protein
MINLMNQCFRRNTADIGTITTDVMPFDKRNFTTQRRQPNRNRQSPRTGADDDS